MHRASRRVQRIPQQTHELMRVVGNHHIPSTEINARDRGHAANVEQVSRTGRVGADDRNQSFPSATPNPSLDPLMHEGPAGGGLASDRGMLVNGAGTNGSGYGANATRLRIPIERRFVMLLPQSSPDPA